MEQRCLVHKAKGVILLMLALMIQISRVRSLSPSASACKMFSIQNSILDHLEGTYSRLPSHHNCNGKQSFRKGSNPPWYIFYSDNTTGWVVTSNWCNETDMPQLTVPTEADYLEDVMETWEEDGVPNSALTVSCADSGCHRIFLDNEWDHEYEGNYYPQTSECNGRSVYYQSDRDHYIYYMMTEDWRGWVIGETMCGTEYQRAVSSDSWSPQHIDSVWERKTWTYVPWERIDHWAYNFDLTLRCHDDTYKPAQADGCHVWRGATIGLICLVVVVVIILVIVVSLYEVRKDKAQFSQVPPVITVQGSPGVQAAPETDGCHGDAYGGVWTLAAGLPLEDIPRDAPTPPPAYETVACDNL